MEALKRLAWVNSMRRVNSIGTGVGHANFPNRRFDGSGSADAATGSGTDIEIHVIPNGGNEGIVVDNSRRGTPPTFNSGSSMGSSVHNAGIRNGVLGSAGVTSNGGRGAIRGSIDRSNGDFGAPRRPASNVVSSVGSGAYGAEVGDAGNFGIRNSGVGRSSVGNSDLTGGIIRDGIIGNGGRNFNGRSNTRSSITGITAAASTRTGNGGTSSALVGVAGVRATSSRSGLGPNDGTRRLSNGDPVMANSGLVGVGGAFSSSGASDDNFLNLGAGTVGASYGGRRGSGVPGMRGVSRAFSGAVGVNEGTAASIGGRAGASSFARGSSLFGAESRDEVGPTLEDNELDGPDASPTDDDRGVGSRSRG